MGSVNFVAKFWGRLENGLREIASCCVHFHTLDHADTGLQVIFHLRSLRERTKSEPRGVCGQVEGDEILL